MLYRQYKGSYNKIKHLNDSVLSIYIEHVIFYAKRLFIHI